MVDSRAKGYRAESNAKTILKKYTGLNWERVPASGALSAKHGLKGDLYIPNSRNEYCVEVKHYKNDELTTKVLTSKTPTVYTWWEQTLRQAKQVEKLPLLIFKFDRSKFFVVFQNEPTSIEYEYIYLSEYGIYISLLEEWLKYEEIIWE